MINTETDKFIDAKAAAEIIGVAETTLRSWRRRECGPAYHQLVTGGEACGLVRYSYADLMSWMGACRVEHVKSAHSAASLASTP